jgi:hypothetical protein
MEEIFPVLAGVGIGLVAHLMGSIRLRAILIGVFGFAFGACASWISGELFVSWIYLVVDTVQVVGASLVTATVIWVSRRHRARNTAR